MRYTAWTLRPRRMSNREMRGILRSSAQYKFHLCRQSMPARIKIKDRK